MHKDTGGQVHTLTILYTTPFVEAPFLLKATGCCFENRRCRSPMVSVEHPIANQQLLLLLGDSRLSADGANAKCQT